MAFVIRSITLISDIQGVALQEVDLALALNLWKSPTLLPSVSLHTFLLHPLLRRL